MYLKSVKFRIILSLAFIVFTIGVRAQEDSVVVVSQEATDETYYNLKYESLDMFLRDETRLFKIAVSPFKPNEKYDFSIILSQLAYERKLNKSWSGVVEINQEFMILKDGNIFINSFDLGVRNYLFKAKQIRKGISGNNCNGLYAGAKASNLIRATKLATAGTHDSYVGFNPTPELNIGIQQRISNLFYVDANAFVNYNFETSEPGLGLKILIGFAINAGE